MKKNDMLSSLSDCQKEELYKEGLELIEDQDCQLGAIDSMPTLNISGIFCHVLLPSSAHMYSGVKQSVPSICLSVVQKYHEKLQFIFDNW